MKQVRTLVFGLSGNPPTQNHLLFIQHLLKLPGYDLLRVILNHQSPLKQSQDYIPAEARFALLKAMLKSAEIDLKRCILERIEIDRPAPSRMIDTLTILHQRAKQHGFREKITLVLGLDALKVFTDWYQWDTFGALCEIKFYPRDNERMSDQAIKQKIDILRAAGIKARFVSRQEETVPMLTGSATSARQYYASGKSGVPEGISEVVDQMIRAHGYYGAKSLT